MYFEWSDDLATGNAEIDSQHKALFAAADALFCSCQVGGERQEVEKTMEFLLQYTIRHFADEEALQVRYDYPGYPAHKQAHADFTELARGLAAKLPQGGPFDDYVSEVYTTIGEWLLNHIRGEDLKMAEYIHGKTK